VRTTLDLVAMGECTKLVRAVLTQTAFSLRKNDEVMMRIPGISAASLVQGLYQLRHFRIYEGDEENAGIFSC
jgi:hypothetical protein